MHPTPIIRSRFSCTWRRGFVGAGRAGPTSFPHSLRWQREGAVCVVRGGTRKSSLGMERAVVHSPAWSGSCEWNSGVWGPEVGGLSLQGPLLALLAPGYTLLVFRPICYTSPDRGRDRKVYEVSTLGHSWHQAECVNKETPITLFVQIGKLRYLGQNYTWEMRVRAGLPYLPHTFQS